MTDDDMHRRVSWLQPADTPILRVLSPPEIDELSPSDIAHNSNYSTGYVRDRLGYLTAAGLAYRKEPEDHYPVYGITDLGLAYLNDELTAEELEDLYSED